MTADVVIVGAGSAGCALAYRLAMAGRRVDLIEAGGPDWGPFIQMPAALSFPMNMRRYDWGFRTEPEPHLGGRVLATPRGRVWGGSSSINGMVFVRGHPRDFDGWRDAGAAGWGWDDVLPYFRRMETWHGGPPHALRGTDGPVHVTRGARRNPLYDAFIAAGQQAGWPHTPDYNGENQEGFGPMEATIWRGRRWSTANAYLRPGLRTGRLRLIRGLASHVTFRDDRASGVALAGGAVIAAAAEVVLAAGPIMTPLILMRSGIGPADHLRGHAIAVRADRPGVGANLQDHLEVYMQFRSLQPITLFSSYNLLGMARVGAAWMLARRGLGTSNQFEAAGFIRSRPEVGWPDIQFHFLPLAVRYDGKAAAAGHGFQAHVGTMRSPARGTVRLTGPGVAAAPAIRFNYMSDPSDFPDFRAAVRWTRRIMDQPAMAPFRGPALQPADDATRDAQIDAFVRAHAESAYHPCGTARIGAADDPQAVVDPALRVIGAAGLRVADSSVFPRITNGNLNAPSIMVGEKAADHVLGRI